MPGRSSGLCLQGRLLHAASLLSCLFVQPVLYAFPHADGDGVLPADRGLGGDDAVHLQASEGQREKLSGEAFRYMAGGCAAGCDLLLYADEPYKIRNRSAGAAPFDGSLLLWQYSGTPCADDSAEGGRPYIGSACCHCVYHLPDYVYGAADCIHGVCTPAAL